MAHHNLTIVSVHGHTNGAATIPAILKSMKELPGSKGLLLSPAKPDNLPDSIHWRQIGTLDYRSYSTFIMHCLYAFIETDYCLIVQDDGWVLDGKNWRDEYYDYDYIGGITHAGLKDNKLFLGFTWIREFDPILVLNGGFSLRSRKFLEAANKYGIAQSYSEEIHLWNEDVQLSCLKRTRFEELGFKYAPNEVAKTFSMEYVAPEFHDDLDFSKLLGHHCTSRKLIGDNTIFVPRTKDQIDGIYRESEFLDYLKSIGYDIFYDAPNLNKARLAS